MSEMQFVIFTIVISVLLLTPMFIMWWYEERGAIKVKASSKYLEKLNYLKYKRDKAEKELLDYCEYIKRLKVCEVEL